MSGGVDSSTVAAILQKEGYDVFGITMRIHDYSDSAIENAEIVCKKLAIEHFIFDVREEFKKSVMDVFAEYYSMGLTPNPCAICNRDIKLNLLLQFAKSKGADFMATGHYANLDLVDDGIILSEAEDKSKDQSYFLSLVKKENLKFVRFPLGKIDSKSETRKLAFQFDLHNFEKKDSQDICFIQNGNYKDFLKSHYSELNLFIPGDIRLQNSNKILGHHNGIANYTIGQRKGLGIAYETPLYVVNLDANKNEVIVAPKDSLEQKSFSINSVNWILDYPDNFVAFVKLRSVARKTKAQIEKSNKGVVVTLLEKSTTPITSGQVCAIYNSSNQVVAAGIIQHSAT